MMKSKQGGFHWQNWDIKSGYRPTRWRSTVSAPLCAFCNKAVYPAEEVIGAGQKYHKLCLKCTSCYALLNTSNHHEHEKKIYCGTCYGRQFGPRRSINNLLTMSMMSNETPPDSPNIDQREMTEENPSFERQISIHSIQSIPPSDNNISYSSNPFLNKLTFVNGSTIQKLTTRSSMPNLASFKPLSNSGNRCPRCSKTVYLAEEVRAAGKSYHKLCYSCAYCKGSINGGRYSEHAGELYDNNCYKRLFGPKGIFANSN